MASPSKRKDGNADSGKKIMKARRREEKRVGGEVYYWSM